MNKKEEILSYFGAAEFLADNTAIWSIHYMKDYLRGKIKKEKMNEILFQIFKENEIQEVINKIADIIKAKDGFIYIENLSVKVIEEMEKIKEYLNMENEELDKVEIKLLIDALIIMYQEILVNIYATIHYKA